MKSINHHTPPLSTHKLNWLSTNTPPNGFLPRHNFYLPLNHVRSKPMAMAMTSYNLVVLAVNAPPTHGDVTVLIATSAAFFLLYWIANFVVPEILMKELEAQDASEDQKPNED